MIKLVSILLFALVLLVACQESPQSAAEKARNDSLEKGSLFAFKLVPKYPEKKEEKKEPIKFDCKGNELDEMVKDIQNRNVLEYNATNILKVSESEEVKKYLSRGLTFNEFYCLGMDKIKMRYGDFEKEKGENKDLDHDFLTYDKVYSVGRFMLHSVHYDASGKPIFFTTYGGGPDGAYVIRLFTICPKTNKVKDAIYISDAFSDMGFFLEINSYFINERVFVKRSHSYFYNGQINHNEDISITETSFKIDSLGNIQPLGHLVVYKK